MRKAVLLAALIALPLVALAQAPAVEVAKCRSVPYPAVPFAENACGTAGYGGIDEASPTVFAATSDGAGAQYNLPRNVPDSWYVRTIPLTAPFTVSWRLKSSVVDTNGRKFAAVAPPTTPAPPTIGTTATITWQAPVGGATPTGYRVWVGKDGGPILAAGTTAADVRRFVSTGLAPGAYLFTVSTLAGELESGQATPAAATVSAPQLLPGVPGSVQVTVTVTVP